MSALPNPGPGLLWHDLELLGRLRNAGLFVGLRPLPALVAIRRARRYGEGDSRLVAALKAIAEASIPGTDGRRRDGGTCPDCRGQAWRCGRDGSRVCGNCGYVPERKLL